MKVVLHCCETTDVEIAINADLNTDSAIVLALDNWRNGEVLWHGPDIDGEVYCVEVKP